MRWDLHGIMIEGLTNDATLAQSWQRSFASLPVAMAVPHLTCQLNIVNSLPLPPDGQPHFRQGDLLHYHVNGHKVIAHFPRFGQLQLDLAQGTTLGHLIPDALHTYGVLEDLIAISLSPHLRRRGLFLIHAFAAVSGGTAVLLVGGIGAGKTTTGMALLNAGWQLLSNDSPLINTSAQVLSYPGLLAAYPETFAQFGATRQLAEEKVKQNGRAKLTIPVTEIWPDAWIEQSPIAAICFPQIEQRPDHALTLLTAAQALTRLLPHAIEQWDKAMIPTHLTTLRRLVEAAPAYILHLSPDVTTIPAILSQRLRD
jgi:hypothetical protein